MNKFVVFEGLDGAGKSTQINKLKQYLNEKNIKFNFLHFPRLENGIYGEMVAKFLRGDYGGLQQVHPELVTLLYAGDRKEASFEINNWLKEGLVIVDRYVYSNIAYQCAKLNNDSDKINLTNWINNFEYNFNNIPKPDLSIFLDVPFSFTAQKLQSERKGDDRNYLKGKDDIHEKDLLFQEKVRKEYLNLIEKDNNFIKIDCNKNDNMLDSSIIFEIIISTLKNYKIIE